MDIDLVGVRVWTDRCVPPNVALLIPSSPLLPRNAFKAAELARKCASVNLKRDTG